jgi:multiple sugar transport system permease protein
LVGLVLFSIIPIGTSLYLSLTEWDIIGGPPKFQGLKNYVQILRSEEMSRTLGNTLYFIVLYIPLILIASILVAMLLNNKARGIGIYRTIYYIPVLTSWVAAALLWKWLLNSKYGAVNAILGVFGIQGPSWLQDKVWAMPGIVLASIWKDMGYFALIFLAGLQGISKSYYEAAEIDGANALARFRYITLPLITPTLFFVMVICIINSFQLFPQVMVMTEGGPGGATQVFVERIYSYAFRYYKMGYAASLSWILFVFIFVATLIQLGMQKRWVHYDS